ncbi:MAG: DNA-3-methyladenine glycosylase 2 family protein [Deltaproteobacteria bacterium]|nr:DNA-3-methyladenine glycosylase 2 family protein [Deltaproteobacteria bacterium]
MSIDRAAAYRALQTRDTRFDGRIFVAVHTTGIYCRPICPARTPKLENIDFLPSAAAAQAAGFRPCLRCRPECSPDLAAWHGTSSTVARALGLIAEGALDGDDADVGRLADRLGIGPRQLRRLFTRHLGASPIVVGQTRRILFAKQLIHETRMSMTAVAEAAGFGSVRRFNATFRGLYGTSPSALRRLAPGSAAVREPVAPITLKIGYAGPYDWEAMIAFFAARAIAGVEVVEPRRYRRTIALDGACGTVEVAPLSGRDALAVTVRFPSVRVLPAIIARVRRMFDVGADVAAIDAELARDPDLAPLVRARPGLRVPGAWDAFELVVRATLGQQITVSGARRLAGKVVAAYGARLPDVVAGTADGLTSLFPSAERLARADLAALGMPRARAAALGRLAATAAADPRLFERAPDLDAAIARLRALPGVGDWTAQYVAMRAMREPDAFPASDVGLLRAVGTAERRPTARALAARAEAWRPWRAYAAQHLWTSAPAAGPAVTAEEAVA